MKTPHKHAELIKAWADGADIESLDTYVTPPVWRRVNCPHWCDKTQYRIKPEPKPDSVVLKNIIQQSCVMGKDYITWCGGDPNCKFVFDGETKKLKSVELIK